MNPIKPAKQLGLLMCTALVVGNMIGSGIYLLPATLAPYGWNSIFGWVLTIAGGLLLAAVFAALARNFPRAGGPYAFTQEAFGPAAGFVVAWSYWISIWVGNAAVATGAVSYLSVFFPSLSTTTGLHAGVTIAIIWALTAVNCRGAYLAGRVQLVTTVLKLLPLIAVVSLAAIVIAGDGGASLAPFEAEKISLAPITAAATLTLWGLLGLESATVPAEKVKDPARTIPRATMIGMVLTGVIYLFACSAIILLQPADEVATSSAPFADFVARHWGANAGRWLALFAAISGFGALNGWIMLQGELPYAMARGGVFPAFLAKNSARDTPVRAHVVSSLLLTAIVMLNYSKTMTEAFTFVLLLSTTASLVMYFACALAALKLKLEGRLQASSTLIVIAGAAALYALWAIYGAGAEAVGWGLALLVAGIPVYFIARRDTANPQAR
ncbi:MAG: amino acid permease [Alphaproteobacteria bacterium RIFCSPHIGHO2_12_FULL_63_12]|nr:MAG: amino acid permease [Alphaproteobacteria bacterium RIFCSPHIGHO2_12_FULL_63_12]